jgi:amino acid transporter
MTADPSAGAERKMALSDFDAGALFFVLGIVATGVITLIRRLNSGKAAVGGWDLSVREEDRRAANVTMAWVLLAALFVVVGVSSGLTALIIESAHPNLDLNLIVFPMIGLFYLGLGLFLALGPRVRRQSKAIGERIAEEVVPKPVVVPVGVIVGSSGPGGDSSSARQPESRP